MPNEQTSVPLFTSGEVLTAANMNLSAGTGVPVFTNTTTRDAAFGGAGEKVLAEGQLCYLSSTNVVQYYDGAAWATVGPASPGALTLIKTQVVGTTVASVNVTSAFSSTYDNYKIVYSGGLSSTGNSISMQLGATTTGYYNSLLYNTYSVGTSNGAATANGSSFDLMGRGETGASLLSCELISPNLALNTFTYFIRAAATTSSGQSGTGSGYLNNTTQYTDFTIAQVGGTLTGGTIYVYGYAKA